MLEYISNESFLIFIFSLIQTEQVFKMKAQRIIRKQAKNKIQMPIQSINRLLSVSWNIISIF